MGAQGRAPASTRCRVGIIHREACAVFNMRSKVAPVAASRMTSIGSILRQARRLGFAQPRTLERIPILKHAQATMRAVLPIKRRRLSPGTTEHSVAHAVAAGVVSGRSEQTRISSVTRSPAERRKPAVQMPLVPRKTQRSRTARSMVWVSSPRQSRPAPSRERKTRLRLTDWIARSLQRADSSRREPGSPARAQRHAGAGPRRPSRCNSSFNPAGCCSSAGSMSTSRCRIGRFSLPLRSHQRGSARSRGRPARRTRRRWHPALAVHVERAGRLIEDEDFRIAPDRACRLDQRSLTRAAVLPLVALARVEEGLEAACRALATARGDGSTEHRSRHCWLIQRPGRSALRRRMCCTSAARWPAYRWVRRGCGCGRPTASGSGA